MLIRGASSSMVLPAENADTCPNRLSVSVEKGQEEGAAVEYRGRLDPIHAPRAGGQRVDHNTCLFMLISE